MNNSIDRSSTADSTAESFFKSKAKDPYGQEQLSSVYRAWRDYLTLCLDECLGSKESYTVLHTASLVGLFTCIFVKSSLRPRISNLEASEVKTGMGGLHGNKVREFAGRLNLIRAH